MLLSEVMKVKHPRLGRVSPSSVQAREEVGIPRHKWIFDRTIDRDIIEQRCEVCGEIKRINANTGRKIYR